MKAKINKLELHELPPFNSSRIWLMSGEWPKNIHFLFCKAKLEEFLSRTLPDKGIQLEYSLMAFKGSTKCIYKDYEFHFGKHTSTIPDNFIQWLHQNKLIERNFYVKIS